MVNKKTNKTTVKPTKQVKCKSDKIPEVDP